MLNGLDAIKQFYMKDRVLDGKHLVQKMVVTPVSVKQARFIQAEVNGTFTGFLDGNRAKPPKTLEYLDKWYAPQETGKVTARLSYIKLPSNTNGITRV
jgi:hypothetical protein